MKVNKSLRSVIQFLFIFFGSLSFVCIDGLLTNDLVAAEEIKPIITRVRPSILEAGKKAKISGKNLCVRDRLYLNDVELPIIKRSRRGWTVVVPEGVQTGNLIVRSGSDKYLGPQIAVKPPLQINKVTPLSGPPGTTVTLTGASFSTRMRGSRRNRVKLGDVEVRVVAATPTQLKVQIPSRASTGNFSVSVAGEGVSRSSQVFQVSDLLPVIRDFKPKLGNPGTKLTIEGDRFGRDANQVTLKIGDVEMPIMKMNDQTIMTRIPTHAVTGKIAIQVGSKGSVVSSEEFVVRATSSSTGFSPTSGPVGTEIKIFGTRFPNSGVKVQFGNTQLVPAKTVAQTELRVQVPTHAETGPLKIQFANGEVIHVPGTFTLVNESAPSSDELSITSIRQQCNQPGCKVAIIGTGFNATPRNNRVFYGKNPLTIEQASETRLVVTLPKRVGTSRFTVKVRGKGQVQSQPFSIRPN